MQSSIEMNCFATWFLLEIVHVMFFWVVSAVFTYFGLSFTGVLWQFIRMGEAKFETDHRSCVWHSCCTGKVTITCWRYQNLWPGFQSLSLSRRYHNFSLPSLLVCHWISSPDLTKGHKAYFNPNWSFTTKSSITLNTPYYLDMISWQWRLAFNEKLRAKRLTKLYWDASFGCE